MKEKNQKKESHEFKVSFTFDTLDERNKFMSSISDILSSSKFKAGIFLHDDEIEEEKIEHSLDGCALRPVDGEEDEEVDLNDPAQELDFFLTNMMGSVKGVARILGLDPSTVYRKIKKFGLDLNAYKR